MGINNLYNFWIHGKIYKFIENYAEKKLFKIIYYIYYICIITII